MCRVNPGERNEHVDEILNTHPSGWVGLSAIEGAVQESEMAGATGCEGEGGGCVRARDSCSFTWRRLVSRLRLALPGRTSPHTVDLFACSFPRCDDEVAACGRSSAPWAASPGAMVPLTSATSSSPALSGKPYSVLSAPASLACGDGSGTPGMLESRGCRGHTDYRGGSLRVSRSIEGSGRSIHV